MSRLPIPPGFELLEGRDGSQLLIRSSRRSQLPELETAVLGLGASGVPVLGVSGRGAVLRLCLSDGTALAARTYRHGGFLAPLTRSLGMGFDRAVCEVVASEDARAREVPTPAVVGVYFSRPNLRGPVLLTEVVGGRRIEEIWNEAPAVRGEAIKAVAATVDRMFEAGIVHPDLNLTNFLIEEGEPTTAHLLDLDGARRIDHLSLSHKRRMLRRMARSWRKLSIRGSRRHRAWDGLCFLRELARLDPEVERARKALRTHLGRRFRFREMLWRLSGSRSNG